MLNFIKEFWYVVPAVLLVLVLMYAAFVLVGLGFMWLGEPQ